MADPRVTVLLPVFNGEPYLQDAIASVLAQTYRDFELLIVDDGSTDRSPEIAARFAAADGRVRICRREHRGLVDALNFGIEAARGEYIARADADDVNLPHRLKTQVELLDATPDVTACGTWVTILDGGAVWHLPTDPAALHAALLFAIPMFHPTVMVRRRWLVQSGLRYDPAFAHAEDYDLWERGAANARYANVPRALVRYRHHPQQVSRQHADAQLEASRRVRGRMLNSLGVHPSSEESDLHERLCYWDVPPERSVLAATRAWFDRLAAANRGAERFPEPAFSRLLITRWGRVCALAGPSGFRLVGEYVRSDLVRRHPESWPGLLRVFLLRHLPPRARAAMVQVQRQALSWRSPGRDQ